MQVKDEVTVDLSTALREIPRRIEGEKMAGGKVLVHCAAGVSRSATLVLAYLIGFQDMTLLAAHAHLKAARSVIRPNNGFWRQLVALEIELRGATSITMVKSNGGTILLAELFDFVKDFKRTLKGSHSTW